MVLKLRPMLGERCRLAAWPPAALRNYSAGPQFEFEGLQPLTLCLPARSVTLVWDSVRDVSAWSRRGWSPTLISLADSAGFQLLTLKGGEALAYPWPSPNSTGREWSRLLVCCPAARVVLLGQGPICLLVAWVRTQQWCQHPASRCQKHPPQTSGL